MYRTSSIAPAQRRRADPLHVLRLHRRAAWQDTAIDDLANRLSHGINLTNAQMAFTLINTIVPIEGMSPVGELRMIPDPETFTIPPGCPSTPA